MGCRQLLVVQGVVYVFCSYPEMVVEQMSAEHVMIELYEDRIQQMDCHSGLHQHAAVQSSSQLNLVILSH